jgi:hypothetical protein
MTRFAVILVASFVALLAIVASVYFVNPAPLVFAVFAVAGLLAAMFEEAAS